MPHADYQISVVIVNFRSGGDLTACLKSFQALTREVRTEIVVVDNSPPEAVQVLSNGKRGQVRIVEGSPELGYSAGCNLGLSASTAPWVLFANPDTRYLRGSMDRLLAWLGEHSEVALVGPRIENPNGTRQLSCRGFPGFSTALAHRHSLLYRFFPRNPLSRAYLLPDLDGQPVSVDWASGCCLLARRQALAEVGGFDEGYFLFFEDVDLAFRLKEKNWRCVYYPRLSFVHTIGVSRDSLSDRGEAAKYQSAIRYFSRNGRRGMANALLSLAGSVRLRLRSVRSALAGGAGSHDPAAGALPPPPRQLASRPAVHDSNAIDFFSSRR